jgi:protein-tyrosine phosphatase
MYYSQIFPDLYLGPCPRSPRDIDDLGQEAGITAVLNLQTDEDFRHWQIDWPPLLDQYLASSIIVRRVPVRDFDTVDLRDKLIGCVRALQELLAANHTVYLHCTAGVERSPSVAIAYLVWCRGMSLEGAASYVLKRHRCSPDLSAIRAATVDSLRSKGCEPEKGQ